MRVRSSKILATHHPIVHGGKNSANLKDSNILDFSSNINPVGLPPSVITNLKKRLDAMTEYPDQHSSDLLRELQNYTGLPTTNLAVGNGAIEIIYNFCSTFLSKKKIMIPIPTFGEYEIAAKLANCKIIFFKTMNLTEDLDDFISQIPRNGCIFLCNPNNPTGKILSKKNLIRIISSAQQNSCLVFVDECFIELVPKSNQSVLNLVKQFDNLFVLRSLTKSFAMPGIRLGYAGSSKPIINVLQKVKIPWSVNTIAQEAGIIALKDKSHLLKSNLIIKQEYLFLKNKISSLEGFECYDSSTNFILIRTKTDSTTLQKKLLKHKILIRDCKNFRGLNNHYIRIAIKKHKDNLKLLKSLETVK